MTLMETRPLAATAGPITEPIPVWIDGDTQELNPIHVKPTYEELLASAPLAREPMKATARNRRASNREPSATGVVAFVWSGLVATGVIIVFWGSVLQATDGTLELEMVRPERGSTTTPATTPADQPTMAETHSRGTLVPVTPGGSDNAQRSPATSDADSSSGDAPRVVESADGGNEATSPRSDNPSADPTGTPPVESTPTEEEPVTETPNAPETELPTPGEGGVSETPIEPTVVPVPPTPNPDGGNTGTVIPAETPISTP